MVQGQDEPILALGFDRFGPTIFFATTTRLVANAMRAAGGRRRHHSARP